MKDVIKVARDMDKLGYIMIIEFKPLQWEKMRDIILAASEEIVHRNHVKSLCDKPVTQV